MRARYIRTRSSDVSRPVCRASCISSTVASTSWNDAVPWCWAATWRDAGISATERKAVRATKLRFMTDPPMPIGAWGGDDDDVKVPGGQHLGPPVDPRGWVLSDLKSVLETG